MSYQFQQTDAARKARAVIAEAQEAQRRAQEKLVETINLEAQLKARQAEAERAARRAERKTAKVAHRAAALEAELRAQIAITAAELSARMERATYRPTLEAVTYWQQYRKEHPETEAPEVGWRRLQAATREAVAHDATKRKRIAA